MTNTLISELFFDFSLSLSLLHEINDEESVFRSRAQNAGQNQYIKMQNKSFGIVAKFEYLGSNITVQNCIHEEIKSRFDLSFGAEYFVFQWGYSKIFRLKFTKHRLCL